MEEKRRRRGKRTRRKKRGESRLNSTGELADVSVRIVGTTEGEDAAHQREVQFLDLDVRFGSKLPAV
jgi:hypothetical protein